MEHFLAQLDWVTILTNARDIASGLLMVLGGAAVIARYTKWAIDAKLLSIIEQSIKFFIMAVPFITTIIQQLRKKDNGPKDNK